MKFVIRLNASNNVRITDQSKNKIVLKVAKGETKVWKNVYYKGEIKVDIIGYFGTGHEDNE